MRKTPPLQGIVALVLTGILGIFMLSAGAKFVLRNVFPESEAHVPVGDADAHAVDIDWAALYPFDGAQDADTADARPRDPFSAYLDRVSALKASLEAYAGDDILLHDWMAEAANRYDRLLGFTIRGVGEYNALVTLPDGYLASVYPACDMTQAAADIAAFAASQAAAGTPVLYVQAPFKINARDAGVYGVVDFTNQNTDALLSDLRLSGVDVLDLREPLADGGDWHALFFRTDHHWRPETGLRAAGLAAERLNADCGFAIDTSVFAESQYTFETYRDCFFGSQGKKATLAASAPEDFTLIYPRNDMRYTLSIPSLRISRSGDFTALYQMSMLGSLDYYNDNPYSAYFFSDVPLRSVHNESIGNGKRLLVLSDSFGNVFTPFLCQQIEHVDALDLRYFTGSLTSYLAQNVYDAILVLYCADTYGYPVATKPHTGWHDFR